MPVTISQISNEDILHNFLAETSIDECFLSDHDITNFGLYYQNAEMD